MCGKFANSARVLALLVVAGCGAEVSEPLLSQASDCKYLQGLLVVTESRGDLALMGSGFLEVTKNDRVQFIRGGTFLVNDQGDLVDRRGYRLVLLPDEVPTATSVAGWEPPIEVNLSVHGVLWLSSQEGQRTPGYRVPIVLFERAEALLEVEPRVYEISARSGPAVTGAPGEGGRGTLFNRMLELDPCDE